MSYTFESTEEALVRLVPRKLSMEHLSSVSADMDTHVLEVGRLDEGGSLLVSRMAACSPKCLHPQQLDLMNGAHLEGSLEAKWGSFSPKSPRRDWSQDTVSLMDMDTVGAVQPGQLEPALLDRLSAAMDAATQEVQGKQRDDHSTKILEFPGRERKETSGSWLKVAAAIAVLGAAVGSFLPSGSDSAGQALATNDTLPAIAKPASSASVDAEPVLPSFATLSNPQFVPASLDSKVRSPQDQGLAVDEENGAHRRVEVEQVEHLILIDELGRAREFERPRGRRLYQIPVETH